MLAFAGQRAFPLVFISSKYSQTQGAGQFFTFKQWLSLLKALSNSERGYINYYRTMRDGLKLK